LVKSVTCHVVAGQPWSSVSTDHQLGIPLYRLLESVTRRPTRERQQGGADWQGGLAGWPHLGPTGQWPLHTTSSCQVHPHGDTYFGGIPIFLVIS
jgi:hypothetical protein